MDRLLFVCGLLLMLSSLLPGSTPPASLAQGLPPRATITPIPTATATPAPRPTSRPRRDPTPEPARITGTVIDLTSGAPASGIAVVVGDQQVRSDANGNYDRTGLAAGNYTVALALAPGQGEPAQAPISIALPAGATVVQHLAFRSPPPAPVEVATTPPQLPNTAASAAPATALALLGLLLLVAGLALRAGQRH